MRNLLMTALLFGAVPAAADTATLFRAGQFAAASAAGEREGTSGALVLAARAELSMAAFDSRTKDDAEVRLARARALANQALVKEPGNVTALVQKGIAVGYDAQLRSSPGGAKEARRLFEDCRRPRAAGRAGAGGAGGLARQRGGDARTHDGQHRAGCTPRAGDPGFRAVGETRSADTGKPGLLRLHALWLSAMRARRARPSC